MDYRWLANSHMLDVGLRTPRPPRHANPLNRLSPPGSDINSIVALRYAAFPSGNFSRFAPRWRQAHRGSLSDRQLGKALPAKVLTTSSNLGRACGCDRRVRYRTPLRRGGRLTFYLAWKLRPDSSGPCGGSFGWLKHS
jgi:hypothetical protein